MRCDQDFDGACCSGRLQAASSRPCRPNLPTLLLRMSITQREAERSLLASSIRPKLPPASSIGLSFSCCCTQSACCFLSFQSSTVSVLRVHVTKSPQNRPFAVTETPSFWTNSELFFMCFASWGGVLRETNLFLSTNLSSDLYKNGSKYCLC